MLHAIDAVIQFANLPAEIVAQVVDKFIIQLETQLADRNVTIELSEAARKWLAEKGFDPLYGARPLARIIQENVKKPLAEELLFGKLEKGGTVRVGVEDGKLTFVLVEAVKPAKGEGRGRDGGGGGEPVRLAEGAGPARRPSDPRARARR